MVGIRSLSVLRITDRVLDSCVDTARTLESVFKLILTSGDIRIIQDRRMLINSDTSQFNRRRINPIKAIHTVPVAADTPAIHRFRMQDPDTGQLDLMFKVILRSKCHRKVEN